MTFTISRDGQQLGVYSPEEVRRELNEDRLRETDLAWFEQERRWLPVADLLAAPTPDSPDELALSAFVGRKYSTYYKAKWAGFDARHRTAWNWAAFFAGPFWFAYRKMYAVAWIYLGLAAAADLAEAVLNLGRFSTNGIFLVLGIMIARQGNYWYKDHVTRRIAAAKPDDPQRLAAEGGTSSLAVVALAAALVVYGVAFALLTN